MYLPARDAMISGSRSMDEATRQRLLDKELVRRGLLLEEEDVLRAMEHGEGGPRFLPLRVSARTGKISGEALVSAQKAGPAEAAHPADLGPDLRRDCPGTIDADPVWRGGRPGMPASIVNFSRPASLKSTPTAGGGFRR